MPWQKTCRQCGHKGNDVSSNYLCPKCQLVNIHKSAEQMKRHKGEYYERWKRKLRDAMRRLCGE